jgi:outer membrane murein-binding lipoprotein Lpp
LNRVSANQASINQASINQASIERNTYSRRVAKIQERFNALPPDVQQDIMRLREPDARANTQVDAQTTLSIPANRTHPEAA